MYIYEPKAYADVGWIFFFLWRWKRSRTYMLWIVIVSRLNSDNNKKKMNKNNKMKFVLPKCLMWILQVQDNTFKNKNTHTHKSWLYLI